MRGLCISVCMSVGHITQKLSLQLTCFVCTRSIILSPWLGPPLRLHALGSGLKHLLKHSSPLRDRIGYAMKVRRDVKCVTMKKLCYDVTGTS